MAYFPFYIDLKNKNCYIIGGGKVALRKVQTLLEYEAKITLISENVCDEIELFKNEITIIYKSFEMEDLVNPFYVVSATNDNKLNEEISDYCLGNNILVNVVDDIDKCNFIFPAVLKEGDITIGVSTSGKSPVMSGVIRDYIKETMPSFYPSFVAKLGDLRQRVKDEVSQEKSRFKIFKKLCAIGLKNNGEIDDETIDRVVKGDFDE